MIRLRVMKYSGFVLIFLALSSTRVAVSVVTLQCDSLQQLCPDDDQPRMCVCNVTGATLRWRSSTVDQIATFFSDDIVDTSIPNGGFIAVLTGKASGSLLSTLTFNPSTVSAAGLDGINVTCQLSNTVGITNNLAVTSAVVPGMRMFMDHDSLSCDATNQTYQVTLQWNDGDTGGPDVSILYYLVELTSSPPTGFVCPPEQCNVTTSTTTITGLSCSTEYSFTVKAVNCIGTSDVSDIYNVTTPTPMITPTTIGEPPCFDREINMTRYTLNEYTGCYAVTAINISSNCTNMTRTITGMMAGEEFMLPSTSQFCEVTEVAITNCGNSEPDTRIAGSECPAMTSTPSPSPTMAAVSPSSPMSTSDNTRPTTPIGTTMPLNIPGIAGGAGGAIAAIVAVILVMATIFVCMFCPCACCMPCRRMCCGCCPEEKICYRWGSDDDYCEPTPHVEKQPVLQNYSTETKEKDVETGQPSYPSSAGPMYQDPNTIQRQAAPTTGDLYAQPEKPARHQKQKPPAAPVEMATYQDPNTIQRQAAPTTGDLYAQPDKPKPPRQPAGPAPVYSEVNKSNPSGLVYADLSHGDSPANVRRPQQVADTVYSEVVKESRN